MAYLLKTYLEPAFLYGMGARGLSVLAGLLTPELIARSFSEKTQGLYFTLLGFLGLRQLFEMGLERLLVVQFSHREEGNYVAEGLSNSDLLRGGIAWMSFVAGLLILLGIACMPLLFEDAWNSIHAPAWLFALLASSGILVVRPAIALIEGKGMVVQANASRFWQSFVGHVSIWGMLLCGGGLWSIGMSFFTMSIALILSLFPHRQLIMSIGCRTSRSCSWSRWRQTMFPLQIKTLAVSTSHFAVAGLPILLLGRVVSLEAAGRWGMTQRIFETIMFVGGGLLTTKVAKYGKWYVEGEWKSLWQHWCQQMKAAVGLCAIASIFGLVVLWGLDCLGFQFPSRLVSQHELVLWCLIPLFGLLHWGVEILLRSSGEEPFLNITLLKLGLVLFGLVILLPTCGTWGATLTLLVASVAVLPFDWLLLRRQKHRIE